MKYALFYREAIKWYKNLLHILSDSPKNLTFSPKGKDTIPIQIPANRPRLGTIGKNHIQGSFIFCIKLLFLSALNLILSLRIVPQYYVENSHEPIIPRDLYMQVQEEMVRRANLHSGAKRKKRVYSSKYALSSIVYCSKCEDIYRRIAWNNRGKHSTVWRCCTRVEHGPKKCDAPTIQESDLQDAVVKAVQEVLGGKDVFLPVLEKNIRKVLESESGEQIAEIDRKLKELQQELLRLAKRNMGMLQMRFISCSNSGRMF